MYAIAHVIGLIIKPFIDIRDSYREERRIQAEIGRLYADHIAEHGEHGK